MKPSIPCIIALLCFTLVNTGSAQQGAGRGSGGGRVGAPGAGIPESTGLPIARAESAVKYNSISAGGRLQPKTKVGHQVITNGYIDSVPIRIGRKVREGQTLFTIERNDVSGSFKPAIVASRIDGIVSEVSVQRYDEVRNGDPGVIVIGTEGYILEANISDKDAFKVEVGEQVVGRTIDGDSINGQLIGRSPEPDYNTGLFSLTFEFPNSRHAFIGQFVLVDLPVDRITGIFINRELLIRRYGTFYLWVVDDGNLLRTREVVTGALYGNDILIKEGLSVGERYLTRLTGREREGMSLNPQRE